MIWFDFDNSPHVLTFKPVLKELDRRGCDYTVTARDYAQTAGLLELYGIKHMLIGKHGGTKKFNKITNLFERSSQLKQHLAGTIIEIAVSHGSRTQVIAAKRMGIKSLVMLDYEYTENRIFNWFAYRILMPDVIPDSRLKEAGFNLNKIIRFKGLKEEIYISGFIPDTNYREKIGVSDNEILIVIRPPAYTSNYHDERSGKLYRGILDYLINIDNVKIVILSRTIDDKFELDNKKNNIIYPEKPLDGLNILYAADIALSGGGTMNREAALLGTKTYSFFKGKRPFVDEILAERGLINIIDNYKEISNISVSRFRKSGIRLPDSNLIGEVADIITGLSVQK